MKKRALGGKKKYLFIIGGIVTLLVLGLGGYFAYQQYQKQTAIVEKEKQQVAKTFDELAFRGDREAATEFTQKLNAKDEQAAEKVYLDKIAATESVNEKVVLYNEYIGLAYQNKLYDQVLKAALAVDGLQSSYLTLGAVADAYKVQKNTAREVEYRAKALEAVNQLPPNENTENMKQLYQMKLDDAKRGA